MRDFIGCDAWMGTWRSPEQKVPMKSVWAKPSRMQQMILDLILMELSLVVHKEFVENVGEKPIHLQF
jgi:hypothetical protein